MADEKIYDLEKTMSDIDALKKRREIVGFNGGLIDENYKSVENCVGKFAYPISFAGPIDDIYVPFATTESALVASVNRGLKYLRDTGVSIDLVDFGVTRSPAFRFSSEEEAEQFIDFVESNYDEIEALFNIGHLKLKDIQILRHDNDVFLRFVADTADAMGMNMITISVDKVVKDYILSKSPVKVLDWVLSSNYCSDKKVSMMNIESGRGINVKISARIKADRDASKCENVFDLKYRKGSMLAGCVSSNGQISNVISAIFLAFGQDLGHVPDSSQANFNFEIDGDYFVFSLEIYNLMIGVVGGGTDLSHVQDLFRYCGVRSRSEFAELIGKSCLAGEISLFFSLVDGDLAQAHDRLRNKE